MLFSMPVPTLPYVLKARRPRRLAAAGFMAALLALSVPEWTSAAEPIILEVSAAAVCRGVRALSPIEPGIRFPADVGSLYCFSRIGNITRSTRVRHIWYRGSEERFRISIPVKPPSWRIYSMIPIDDKDIGLWRVEISDEVGNVLKTIFFEISP
jgi:hypothetical protein